MPEAEGGGRAAQAWLAVPQAKGLPSAGRSAQREPSLPLTPTGHLPKATAARSPARGPSSCAWGGGPRYPGPQSSLLLHRTLVWWVKINFRVTPPKL